MKPEDRKRLKQHIEMIVEHKSPVEELEDINRKLRLELHTLRFKESQENRFVWWVYQVYARNVLDLVQSVPVMCPCDTEEDVPFIELAARIKEYTEHIYDGTYLDVEMSTEQSNSDVSMTQDVLTDIKTPQSIENNNPDYYKNDVGKWIPIASGRLPEKFQECIVLDKNNRLHKWIHDDVLLPIFAQYTHWMPLSEPAEEEER